jgi:lysophospholipase L1-like esterase
MKTLKGIATRLLLILIGLVCGCFIFELGIRGLSLYKFPEDVFIEPHPDLGWSHIPNKEGYWQVGKDQIFVRINSKGLRDREIDYRKPEGTFRILLLGDSFVEGFQVPLEDTFSKQLESKLNEQDQAFEVVNAGFGGVGTDYGLLFLEKEGVKYSPDLVLLGFFSGNDVQENFRSREILQNENSGLAFEKRGMIFRLRQFLASHSSAYNYLGMKLPAWIPHLGKILMRFGFLSSQPVDDKGRLGTLPWMVFADAYPPDFKEAWAVTDVLLSKLAQEAQAMGSGLAVFSIPSREQVYPNLWRALITRPAFKGAEWDWQKPDRILKRLAEESGIAFLPLLPQFRDRGKTGELYHSEDGHWNALGNRLASEYVHAWLKEKGLVPTTPDL